MAVSTGSFSNTGALADLYSNTTLEGHHFYNTANQPTWTVNDPKTGQQLGLVSGMAQVRVPVPKQPGDGGFGSVAEVLLIAVKAEGASRASTTTVCCEHACVPAQTTLLWQPCHSLRGRLIDATARMRAEPVLVKGGKPVRKLQPLIRLYNDS